MSHDYDVGYGKPPKHTQFPPGTSGNKGRKKKLPETHRDIIARIRDEVVDVGGRTMSKFEMVIQSTVNQTIKRGHPRDLKALLELLDKYGAIPAADTAAQNKAEGEAVIEKIMRSFDIQHNIDPEDPKAVKSDGIEEAAQIMACPSCGPDLKKRWKDPERRARKKRYGCTGLQKQVDDLFESR